LKDSASYSVDSEFDSRLIIVLFFGKFCSLLQLKGTCASLPPHAATVVTIVLTLISTDLKSPLILVKDILPVRINLNGNKNLV
jgi:hypothetical protein